MEPHTQGRVHQDGVVQLGGGLGDVDRLHLLEAAQRVTLWHQLRDGPLVQSARDQQDDVIDHVAVPEAGTRGGNQLIWVELDPFAHFCFLVKWTLTFYQHVAVVYYKFILNSLHWSKFISL